MADQQVAVLIDLENVGLNSIQWLLDQIADVGRVIVKRSYGDSTAIGRKQRDQLLELGIESIHVSRATNSGKNASDIRLVIDAIELLYQSPVDTFVIVSSDTDFVPLVNKLRSAGKTVIGGGRQATVSRALVTSCDRYYYLDSDDNLKEEKPSSIFNRNDSLLMRAVTVAMDDEGKVLGSKLRETMQRLDPGFDFKAMGYTTFSRYLGASKEVTMTRPRGRGGDVSVELSS
jgi:uncharacterized protein (TIGR00288 family)